MQELATLERALERLRGGNGGVAAVVGDAGLGKSRLTAELVRRHGADVRFLEGRSLSIGETLSYHPFVDLLRHWAAVADQDDELTARAKVGTAVASALKDGAADAAPFILTLMGIRLVEDDARRLESIDSEGRERLITKSLRDLVEAVGTEGPLVLFFEDLHWADSSSIKLLASLLSVVRHRPILILLATRPNYQATAERVLASARERCADCFDEVALGPLDDLEAAQMLRQLIRFDDRPHVTRKAILRKAEGNPFFIEEVVRSLTDVGAIERTPQGLRVTEKIETVEIPGTVQEVVLARVDRLPDQVREVLEIASVIGRSFPARLLAAVTASPEQAEAAVVQLKRGQLLEDGRAGDEVGHAFTHALAQETVYASVLKKTRREIHAKVAASIETLFVDRLADYYGMLAYHFGRAEDLTKAGEYLLKAGDEAERSAASSEALTYFREAARLYDQIHGDGGDIATKAILQKKIGLAYLNKGELPSALDHFDEALALLGEGDPTTEAQATWRLASDLAAVMFHVYVRGGRPRRRQPSPRTREAIEIRFHKGKAQSTSAPKGYFLSMLRGIRALNRIDPSSVELACGIYAASSALFAYSGISFDVSARLLPMAQRLVRTVRDDIGLHTMAFLQHYLSGSWGDAQLLEETLIEEGLRYGVFWEVNTYLGLLCEQRIVEGHFEEARGLIRRVARIGDDYGYDFVRGNEYFMTAYLALHEGRLGDAREAAERYLRQFTEEALNLLALGAQAKIELAAGRVDVAREACRRARDLLERLGQQAAPYHASPHLLATFEVDLHDLATASGPDRGRLLRAARRSGRAAVAIARKIARERPQAFRLMGRYWSLAGSPRQTRRWYERALVEGRRLGARPELRHVCEEAARWLDAQGVSPGTIAGFDASGLRAMARRLESELQPASAPTARSA